MEDGEDLRFRSIYLPSLQDMVGYWVDQFQTSPKGYELTPFLIGRANVTQNI